MCGCCCIVSNDDNSTGNCCFTYDDDGKNRDCCYCFSTDCCYSCLLPEVRKFYHRPQYCCCIFSINGCSHFCHCACCKAGGEKELVLKIATMSERERYKLSDALGIERDDHDGACLLMCVKEVAWFLDNFLQTLTGGFAPCKSILNTFCLRREIARKLAVEMNRHLVRDEKDAALEEVDYKKVVQALVSGDNRIMHHFTQMYWEHVLGFRRKYDDEYFVNRPMYTMEQIRKIARAFKALKYETYTHPLFSEKLIRILNVGGPDHQIEMPCFYSLCVRKNPLFRLCCCGCWQSPQYTKDMVLYFYMNRVPFDRLIYALQNFEETPERKGLWYSYLGEFLHVGVTKGLATKFTSTISQQYIDFFEDVGIEDLYRYEVSENLKSTEKEKAIDLQNELTLSTNNPISSSPGSGKLQRFGSGKLLKHFDGIKRSDK